jgi:glutamate-1-semialdehyde 2,1-aminomutase
MVELFPWADMVKFAKNGSTVTTAAVKLARAFTGRSHVAVCAEHPFFTFDDWFIGTTPMDRGIPAQHASLTLKFHYNDVASLQRLFDEHPGEIACVMLEPATTTSPCPTACAGYGVPKRCSGCAHQGGNFLKQVRDLCTRHGALLVLDEMITGFRWDLHGAMSLYDVEPDLATFGKGMANGFALAALVGKRAIMELGGIRQAGAERVFLISTTHGSEMSAFGAFLATLDEYRSRAVTEGFWSYGSALANGMNALAREEGIADHFEVTGFGCSPVYVTRDAQGNPDLGFRTLFSQCMVEEGVLMPFIALSAAHGPVELERTLTATRRALSTYAKALSDGLGTYLRGPVIKPVFRKYN